jgi:DNA-binding MarR family transcriptional regulator
MNQQTLINHIADDRLQTLLSELEELAKQAAQQGVRDHVRNLLHTIETEETQNQDDTRLADCAAEIYRLRRRRERQLSRDLLGEPCWDLLLDLFTNTVRGIPVSVTGACIATNVPTTTALRWLAILEERGLLKRYPDPFDRRVVLVRLTEAGLTSMRTILGEAVNRGFPSPPALDFTQARRR